MRSFSVAPVMSCLLVDYFAVAAGKQPNAAITSTDDITDAMTTCHDVRGTVRFEPRYGR